MTVPPYLLLFIHRLRISALGRTQDRHGAERRKLLGQFEFPGNLAQQISSLDPDPVMI
jgi:hypothetical protein